MDFLKEILGDELFATVSEKVNAFNGNEANKGKQIKIANLGSGDYVSKMKLDDITSQMAGKDTELANANALIEEMKKATKGNEEFQAKFKDYETENARLKSELAEAEKHYAFDVLLMDSGVKDKESREFLAYKYEKQLKEDGKALELDDNKHIKGGDDIVTSLKTTNPTMFASTDEGDKNILENRLPEGDKNKTVTADQFKTMSYEQRVALKQENEQLYKQLAKN